MYKEEQLRATAQVVRAVRDHVAKLRLHPRLNVVSDRILFGLLSKGLRLGEAVIALVANGFGDEAFGLSRTLIELTLYARYITNNDSEARAERYVGYLAKAHVHLRKIANEHYPGIDLATSSDAEMLARAKEYKSPNSWTGLGGQAKEMAAEADTIEFTPEGRPIDWKFDYDLLYWQTSHYVHGTVQCLHMHLPKAGAPFSCAAQPPMEGNADKALFNAVVYIFKIVVCVFRSIGADADELKCEFDAAIEVFRRTGVGTR